MTISDYLTFTLTGQRMGDCSSASLLGILDVQHGRWWSEALELLELDASSLSAPYRTGTAAGMLVPGLATGLGLQAGVPVYLGGLDHHMAAIGAGLYLNHRASESTGTVLAAVAYASRFSPQPTTCTAPGLDDSHYFQMAFEENGAGSLEWYQKKFAPEFDMDTLLGKAGDVAPGSDGLVAKPCAQSYNDLDGFDHILPSHQHGHFVRAILESTACSLAELVQKLTVATGNDGIVATGGGAMSRLWIKIKADVLGRKFFIPQCAEAACMGAAMVAAAGTDVFRDLGEVGEQWVRIEEVIEPDLEHHGIYSRCFKRVAGIH